MFSLHVRWNVKIYVVSKEVTVASFCPNLTKLLTSRVAVGLTQSFIQCLPAYFLAGVKLCIKLYLFFILCIEFYVARMQKKFCRSFLHRKKDWACLLYGVDRDNFTSLFWLWTLLCVSSSWWSTCFVLLAVLLYVHGGNRVTLITLRGNAQAFLSLVRISEFHRGFGVGCQRSRCLQQSTLFIVVSR
jgi:hypothetical protein